MLTINLLQKFINYGHIKFYYIGPGIQFTNILGTVTFSITPLSIKTLIIMGLFVTLSANNI